LLTTRASGKTPRNMAPAERPMLMAVSTMASGRQEFSEYYEPSNGEFEKPVPTKKKRDKKKFEKMVKDE